MDRNELNDRLPGLVNALVQNVTAQPRMRHTNLVVLPSRDEIIQAIRLARALMYPGYFGKQEIAEEQLPQQIADVMKALSEKLFEQVRCALRYSKGLPPSGGDKALCEECDRESSRIVIEFLDRLPAVRDMLADDVQAAFDSDPAAQSTDETILSYPGVRAITIQRLAHEFYKLQLPLLPRIMTEYAHSLTGIDIHPGAKLGRRFFIDHGTGVVIGETTQIGNNVKLYQGVTLGALAPAFGQLLRGQKRHPTIEDNVTIYSGATILGGETTIGEGSTIGGNVFITSSVPPHNQVTAEPPKLKYRDRRARAKRDFVLDFEI